jgi:hypothetical protein
MVCARCSAHVPQVCHLGFRRSPCAGVRWECLERRHVERGRRSNGRQRQQRNWGYWRRVGHGRPDCHWRYGWYPLDRRNWRSRGGPEMSRRAARRAQHLRRRGARLPLFLSERLPLQPHQHTHVLTGGPGLPVGRVRCSGGAACRRLWQRRTEAVVRGLPLHRCDLELYLRDLVAASAHRPGRLLLAGLALRRELAERGVGRCFLRVQRFLRATT